MCETGLSLQERSELKRFEKEAVARLKDSASMVENAAFDLAGFHPHIHIAELITIAAELERLTIMFENPDKGFN